MQQATASLTIAPPTSATSKKVPLTTSFANQNEKSLYQRLVKYTTEKGLGKPQDAVRLAVSKFLDMEGY
jgi:hypothetical protein